MKGKFSLVEKNETGGIKKELNFEFEQSAEEMQINNEQINKNIQAMKDIWDTRNEFLDFFKEVKETFTV